MRRPLCDEIIGLFSDDIGELTGGWVADTFDDQQYLEVSTGNPQPTYLVLMYHT